MHHNNVGVGFKWQECSLNLRDWIADKTYKHYNAIHFTADCVIQRYLSMKHSLLPWLFCSSEPSSVETPMKKKNVNQRLYHLISWCIFVHFYAQKSILFHRFHPVFCYTSLFHIVVLYRKITLAAWWQPDLLMFTRYHLSPCRTVTSKWEILLVLFCSSLFLCPSLGL